MPKKFMKRHLPSPEKIRAMRSMQFLGQLLHETNLWHISRHSVSRAFMIGIFWCFMPVPFQMLAAAVCAIWFNANLPLSIVLVWISNPLTMPPMFYFNYKFGSWLLNRPVTTSEFQLSVEWLSSRILDIATPLYLGSVILGALAALISYTVLQFIWRRKVRADWRKRLGTRHPV
ncbi:MAG: DUF2062 domain-containing protein [Oleiphilaceae bacterium]|nr:DUF2062 domain-containing protein [Oleiphilaceae bacterium]